MDNKIKDIFLKLLSKTANSEVDKADMIKLAKEQGVEIPASFSKNKVINKMTEEGLVDKLYDRFNESIAVPVWVVADFFEINSDDVLQLQDIGVIGEEAIEKEFYNRLNGGYYRARIYKINILEKYDKKELQDQLALATSGFNYRFRIETDTKNEISEILDKLGMIFKLGKHQTYSKRTGGYYSYVTVKILNNSNLEKNVLLEEMKSLKSKIEKEKNNYKKDMEIMRNLVEDRDKKIEELKSKLKNCKL